MTKKTNTLDKRSYLLGFSDGLELKSKEKCKWHYEDGDYYYVTSCKKECPASEFRQVADAFVFCPYCRKEIEEIKDASIS